MTTAATSETRLLTVPEVAARLRVSRPTVYRRIAAGEVPALRIGGRFGPLRVDERELTRWCTAFQTPRVDLLLSAPARTLLGAAASREIGQSTARLRSQGRNGEPHTRAARNPFRGSP
jgi:excisionase family DNA binding protein